MKLISEQSSSSDASDWDVEMELEDANVNHLEKTEKIEGFAQTEQPQKLKAMFLNKEELDALDKEANLNQEQVKKSV